MEEKKILGQIILPDGTRKNVLEEKGRFFICKDAQFRKALHELVPVKEKPKKKEEKGAEQDAV